MDKILHKQLSYIISGIFFDVHNEVGRFASERQVADLIEKRLIEKNIVYKREFVLPSQHVGEQVGRHRVDFLVEDKIVLEIKYKRFLTREDYAQVQRYLEILNLALGILVNFRDLRLYPKRILNGSGKS